MSAAKIDIYWKESERTTLAVELVRNIAEPAAHLRCPECKSIIYTRRHKLCAVCGRELPEELLFSTVEAARIEELVCVEKRRHRAWMSR